MADYAIGDVQGCYEALQALLEKIKFSDATDRLWFVGDLVNRGPDSLKVLRFIRALKIPPRITLGNHDLHLLCQIFLTDSRTGSDDTLTDILSAPDKLELGHWLRKQAILIHDDSLHVVMTHAGIPPHWRLEEAKTHAELLEKALRGDDFELFLTHMYGNTPNHLSEALSPIDKLRVICNYFTRMRFCNQNGDLELSIKTKPEDAPEAYYPWFELPRTEPLETDLVFGHWAALEGHCPTPKMHAIDTGAVWGGTLTALRLQDMKRF